MDVIPTLLHFGPTEGLHQDSGIRTIIPDETRPNYQQIQGNYNDNTITDKHQVLYITHLIMCCYCDFCLLILKHILIIFQPVTTAFTPYLLGHFLNVAEKNCDLSCFKYIVIAGSAIEKPLLDRFKVSNIVKLWYIEINNIYNGYYKRKYYSCYGGK